MQLGDQTGADVKQLSALERQIVEEAGDLSEVAAQSIQGLTDHHIEAAPSRNRC